eukprot:7196007-Prorocentrum_lima.AAC.1
MRGIRFTPSRALLCPRALNPNWRLLSWHGRTTVGRVGLGSSGVEHHICAIVPRVIPGGRLCP